MHRDDYNIIGQIQSDGSIEGGDSVNWMGHWIYLTKEAFPFVKTFEVKFGSWVRHPIPSQTNNGFGAYYRNPWDGVMSRDQLTGVLAGIIAQKERLAALRLLLHHALRFFLFAYNTRENGKDPSKTKWIVPDPTGPEIWAIELRALGPAAWILWPLICVFDIHHVFNVLLNRFRKTRDPISFAMKYIVIQENIPTLGSIVAKLLLNKKKLISELVFYWGGWRDSPEFVALYKGRL